MGWVEVQIQGDEAENCTLVAAFLWTWGSPSILLYLLEFAAPHMGSSHVGLGLPGFSSCRGLWGQKLSTRLLPALTPQHPLY